MISLQLWRHRFTDNPVRIISNDKDIAQVIDERVQMFITIPGTKGFILRDTKNVVSKFEVNPEQVVDYLSLVGDSSDNIPGVSGIGPKTAANLLQQFGSIDGIINRVDEIKKISLKEKIINSKELMKKNQRLITLDSSIELDNCQSIDQLNIRVPDLNKLLDITEKYELKSLAKEFAKVFEKRMNPSLFDF